MDGLTPALTPALGILYAEDFDAEVAPEPPAPPSPPVLTQSDVDAACAAAVRDAQIEWAESQTRRRTAALAALAEQILDARAESRHHAEALAEATAAAVLGMVAGALPGFCRDHGDAEVALLVRQLLPGLLDERKVVIRVRASLVAAIQADIAATDPELAEMVAVVAAPLAPGDVRVTWADGSFTRDTARILAAMAQVLSQLGLVDPEPQRSMAFAE